MGVFYFSLQGPKKVTNKLESIRREFLLGGNADDNKISWIKWNKVISNINHGGLGIGSLMSTNQAMFSKWLWRICTDRNALRRNVIRSIHEPLGALDDASYKRASSLTPTPVHVTPIEHIPAVTVPYYNFDTSSWLRGLSLDCPWCMYVCSVPENLELIELCELGVQFQLTDASDVSKCTHTYSRLFTIKGMRSFITNSSVSQTPHWARWNKTLPLKVNINTWRILHNRVVTRSDIDIRGIDLDYICCPICDEDKKTKEHIFVKFNVAVKVWNNILVWGKIGNTSITNLNNEINLVDQVSLSSKLLKIFDVVVQTTLWFLRKFRNNTIFFSK
ncbi:RNA-directed DNA polymerase, eukaryota, reverse transcriptase zinc-binding domain protein [Tanacetum coccineum]